MKKIILMVSLILCSVVYAETAQTTPHQVQPSATVSQNIPFETCTKIFGINNEKLLYLTLASISANRFNIEEIQTSNGYIIFTANRGKYLATVAKVDEKNAILKITPCNNTYNFPPGIISNIYKYIDLNLNTEIKI